MIRCSIVDNMVLFDLRYKKMAWLQQTRMTLHKVARTVDRVHNHVRPVYDAARPLLRHAGIDASIPDKALSTYDGIRRSIR